MATSARLEELRHKFNENPRRYFAPLANEHRKLGELDQAISLCRTHLPQQPQHVSGHIVLAQALFEAGNTPDARQAFELALDLDPENLIALRYLGDIARVQGDYTTARQWYERVLDADPRNDEISRLIRDIEAGATVAAPAAAEPLEVESAAATATAPEPNESVAEAPEPPVAADPIEDLATAWQHEVAALDSASTFAAPAEQPEPEPVAAAASEPTPVHVEAIVTELEGDAEPAPEIEAEPEPVLEAGPLAEFSQSVEASSAATEAAAEPNEAWAEPDEEFVASVPTVETTMTPAPPPFAEIDYSMFEAVADEEELASSAPSQPPSESFEQPVPEVSASQGEVSPSHGDDWFAMPSDLETHAATVDSPKESSFDLDAAFQSVLPNNGEEPASLEPEPCGEVPDLTEVPHSREWEGPAADAPIADDTAFSVTPGPSDSAEDTSFSATPDRTDSVDEAFAVLDRMTASFDADVAGNAMLLPDDEYSSEEPEEVPATQHIDPLIGRTPETGVPAIEQAPIAFVTETMAELYLQQGFRDEALAVYLQLLAMSPGDAVLEERVRALEGTEAPIAASAEPDTFDSYSPAPARRVDAAGQSMRAFLGFFARRRAPMRRRERTNEAAAVPQQQESRLSALFGGEQDTDNGAAAVLAGAFAQPNADAAALPGRPTRAASEELSLGSVFGGEVAATGARAATFDEFFSTGSAEQSAPSPLDEEGSDMEQFTAWLEGLKKK